jgi:hypothetical protein
MSIKDSICAAWRSFAVKAEIAMGTRIKDSLFFRAVTTTCSSVDGVWGVADWAAADVAALAANAAAAKVIADRLRMVVAKCSRRRDRTAKPDLNVMTVAPICERRFSRRLAHGDDTNLGVPCQI